jgi:hypothetical protein
MAETTLVAAIESYESLAETDGGLAEDRTNLLNRYLGKPMGNEVDGRSQVVSRDVWDTVEWIKPQLAEVFCGGDEVINFTPRGPEDVKASEQETEFINYVITQKNNWFEIWNAWSHDALLQRVGYVKVYWDDAEDQSEEKYQGLTDEQLVMLLQDEEVEPIESERTEMGWNVTVQRTNRYGCAKIVNVAPERVRIDANARNLNVNDHSCNFSEHFEQKTLSQLRNEGFKVDDDLSDGGSSGGSTSEDATRLDNGSSDTDNEDADPSMRKVWVRECWIRHDSDGDGRAEMRHVILVGKTVLLDEKGDRSMLVALCPIPLPHKHTGLAVGDAVLDLEFIKTALMRGGLDNLYLGNNGRHAVDETMVNLDDMLVSRPGGLVRTKGPPGNAIMSLTHPTKGDVAVPMMEYIDRVAQKRTGVNEQSQGLDPNVLQTATHSAQIATAAMQRIKFIARIFAETGVKTLFGLVHELTLKHSRKAEMIRLRNQWVAIDPREWKKRADMQISVGLGAGDKMQQIVFLQGILEKQMIALQGGLTSPPKIYNALKRLTQAGGFKDPNEFWDDPSTHPPKPPAPPPDLLVEQAKGQVAMQLEDKRAQTTMATEQLRGQLKMQELQANLQLQATNDQRDSERETHRAVMEAQLEQQRQQLDRWMTEATNNLAKYKADQDAQVKLTIAGLQSQSDPSTEVQMLDAERQRQHEMEMKEIDAITRQHTAETRSQA